ncbi:hypothetical protein ONZ45_g11526 [Pleurotus djamor]|nr:hypothetical protein ONZ45_g11526 [Pleurotus djamor]
MSTTYELPTELWKMVVLKLGWPYRNALCPLALVSHTFLEVVTPLIYEFIIIYDHTNDNNTRKPDLENSTYTLPDRIRLLRRTFDNNPNLASYIDALAEIDEYDEDDPIEDEDTRGQPPPSLGIPQLAAILSHLCNIQRLSTFSLQNKHLHLIPDTAPLTHLCLPVSNDWHKFLKSFIEKRTSTIRFLALASPMQELQHVLPASLPRLESFMGAYPTCWDTLAEIAPIKHLSAIRFSANWIDHPERVFTNLLTLKIAMDMPAKSISEVGKYLKNLRALYFTGHHVKMADTQIKDLTTIASPHLSYISIGQASISIIWDEDVSSTHAKILFAQYPSLRIVDFSVRQTNYRYPRDSHSQSPLVIHSPFERIPSWWRDDFGPYF